MEASVVKRSIIVGGHKTNVSLEDPFWNAVKEVAGLRKVTVAALISQIDNGREYSNLSSAIRSSFWTITCLARHPANHSIKGEGRRRCSRLGTSGAF
jgi:predicted DNA-binding ribbon-helix-helix protein